MKHTLFKIQYNIFKLLTLFFIFVSVFLSFTEYSVAKNSTETLVQNIELENNTGQNILLAAANQDKTNNPTKELANLISKFESATKDKKMAAQRDTWLKLANAFAKLTKNKQGDWLPKAIFYEGKSWHELGLRSGSKADFTQAAKHYARLVDSYPKSAFAPEALWHRVVINNKRLGLNQEARTLAEKLVAEYPNSTRAAEAKKFLSGKDESAQRKPQSKPAQQTNEISVAEQLGLTIQTVMIDAGHGGKDPGAVGFGLHEKKLTLDLAKRIGKILEKQGIKVIYTRTTDKYLTVQERPVLANTHKVDLFVSMHVNANKTASLRGLEVYYLDEAKTASAKEVAARENAVAKDKVSDVQFILTDLTLNSKMAESKTLAAMVQKNILAQVKKKKYTLPDHGVRSAPFYVLMGTKMPAILVESAYITNKDDATLLKNDKFLQAQAEGVAAGILAYKKHIESAKK